MSPNFARNSYVVPKRNWGEEDTEFKTELLDSDSEPKELGAKTSQSGKVGKLWERMEQIWGVLRLYLEPGDVL